LGVALFWLAGWELGARLLAQPILLVGPGTVLIRLAELARTGDFWARVAVTFGGIAAGFGAATLLGGVLGILAGIVRPIDWLLSPLVRVLRTVPVFSFIILVLLWTDTRGLGAIVSFLMVMPIMYLNVLEGVARRDPALLDMARVFRLPLGRRFVAIDLPGVWPHFLAACHVGLGLAWKSGISGEVIGLPAGTIGERLYQAKLFLSSADLFAWTLAVIALSIAGEKATIAGLDALQRRLARAWSR
jgi:NitT/TauT family transport system permease protein